jgi:hypothetical protein
MYAKYLSFNLFYTNFWNKLKTYAKLILVITRINSRHFS